MAKNYFKRYIWLIDLISRRGYVTRKEINEAWKRSPLNDTGEKFPERTFFNHRDAILDIFGIEIRNDRSLGFYIAENDYSAGPTAQWMLHTLFLNNVLQENADMRGQILVDKVPSSENYLTDVISAMRERRTINLVYRSFAHPEPHALLVRPYCVKYFKQRWYMLADSEKGLRIYAFDRIVDMEELEETYEIPADFDAASFFSNYFGVIVGDKPEEVILRVEPFQANYVRTLKIHDSQEELDPVDGWPVFKMRVAPTFDLVQEILTFGENAEVLAPATLRSHIASVASQMNAIYSE